MNNVLVISYQPFDKIPYLIWINNCPCSFEKEDLLNLIEKENITKIIINTPYSIKNEFAQTNVEIEEIIK